MNDHQHICVVVAIAAAVVLVTLISGATYYQTHTTCKAMECGYSMATLPGHQGAEWVKRGGETK